MARKPQPEEPENHDRWLVSYADFITLLFAFFVVMYAVSSVNEGKARQVSSAMSTAFTGVTPTVAADHSTLAPPLPLLPRHSRNRTTERTVKREREQLTAMARELLNVLGPLVSQGKVRVTQGARGIIVEINASVLFAPGDAKLSPASVEALGAVAKVLQKDAHAVQVEGHTDNLPIATSFYPSNWELSSVRASSVVRLFVEQGIAPARLTAIGHGANRPVANNNSAEGRVRNRRVQLMILSNLPDSTQEVPLDAQSVP